MGSWQNTDALFLQFGTTKATSDSWGDYVSYGPNRIFEGTVDISTLSTVSPSSTSSGVNVLSQTAIFPPAGQSAGGNSNSWYIEKVEISTETACSSSTSTISIGVQPIDRTAALPSSGATAFVNAMTGAAVTSSLGGSLTLTNASSFMGAWVNLSGTTLPSTSGPYYIIGQVNNPSLTGKFRCRIFYRGIGTITQ